MVSPQNEDAPEHTPEAAPPAPRPRRKGGLIGGLLKGVALLALVAGAAGYGATLFRDADPRIALVADYADQALSFAHRLYSSDPPVEAPRARHAIIGEESAPRPLEPPHPAETNGAPQLDQESVRKAEQDAEEAVKQAEAKAQLEAQAEADARARAEEEQAQAAQKAAEEKAAQDKTAQEKAAQEKAAEERAAAEKASAESAAAKVAAAQPETQRDDLTLRDQISGLEGRIDEIGDQLVKLRERLDAPKNESRAAPETEKPAARSGDSSAARVVVAYALQRRLDAGRPFSDELAALKRLGAESGPLETLAPYAESGAPTADALNAEFVGLAKKMHGDAPHASGDLTEKLLESASKLVKVRPAGQPAPTDNSLEGKIARVEAALARKDLNGAEAAFEALPDGARAEAKVFGEALHARLEADRAAESLLGSGIAALGAEK